MRRFIERDHRRRNFDDEIFDDEISYNRRALFSRKAPAKLRAVSVNHMH